MATENETTKIPAKRAPAKRTQAKAEATQDNTPMEEAALSPVQDETTHAQTAWEMVGPPSVHELWCRVMDSVRSVAKGDFNQDQGFKFRGIDSVVDAVGPALRAHHVHIRPRRILEHSATEYQSKRGARMVNRIVRVEWEVTGPQGDSFRGESMGEAADMGDKSLTKAQSVAYRVYLLQALNIPTGEQDPDGSSHERDTPAAQEGHYWQQQQERQGGSRSYRSREEYEAAQRQAKAGEENQDTGKFPESANIDPWTGAKSEEAQQDTPTVRQPDSTPQQPEDAAKARAEMWRSAKELGWQWGKLAQRFESDFGIKTTDADAATLQAFQKQIESEAREDKAAEEAAKALVQNELGGKEVAPEGTSF